LVLSATTAPAFITQRTLLMATLIVRERVAFDGD